jgi:DNA polymerase-3 subunit alpha
MFISLHTHSDHSLRDGFQTVKDMLSYASALGQTAIALTDHGTMSGCGEGFRYQAQFGIKFIAGCEHYLANDITIKDKQVQHIVLLAMNKTGYRNLNIITTIAHSKDNFYFKPRIDLDLLAKYNEGIICSTACLAGCQSKIAELKKIFGDRLYIEIHTNSLPEQKTANLHWLELADKFDVPFYAAQDAHYTMKGEAASQRAWTPYSYQEDDENGYAVCDDYYLHSEEEVRRALNYLPSDVVDLSIKTTELVADRCNFDIIWGVNHYPRSQYPDPKLEVRKRTWAGCKSKGYDKTQNHIDQIRHEIDVLEKVDYFDYFLIVSDLMNWCAKHGIRTGAGRGSVVGCDVAYMMGITKVNPLDNKLIFERFTNTERVSPCDIDIDVPQNRRQDVIQYIKDTYGEVYQVVTFGKMANKSALKRAGQALRIPHQIIDKLCGNINDIEDLPSDYEDDQLMPDEYHLLLKTARQFRGKLQNYGTHASAVVVLTSDPYDFCAVERFGEGQYNLNYEFKDLEKMGLLKLDILGLETLDIIDNVLSMIPEEQRPDMNNLPEDSDVYDTIDIGKTSGIFQLESNMMGRLIRDIQPKKLGDLIHIVALGRPGPIQAGITSEFIDRKKNKRAYIPVGNKDDLYNLITTNGWLQSNALATKGTSKGGVTI